MAARELETKRDGERNVNETRDITEEYRLKRVLKAAPQSTVFLAAHPETNQEVALKLLSPAQTDALDERKERFLKAIEAIQASGLPTFPTVLEYGFTPESSAFLVTEFVPGEDLDALTGKPPARVVPAMAEVLEALHALAEVGQVHHNLSPDNILVTAEGSPRVIGLGTAAFLALDDGGALLGHSPESDRFSPPEQLDPGADRPAERWLSDLYSMAAIVCSVLDADVQGQGGDTVKVSLPPGVREQIETPDELETALAQALSADPAKRHWTLDGLAATVRASVAQQPAIQDATMQMELPTMAPASTKTAAIPIPPGATDKLAPPAAAPPVDGDDSGYEGDGYDTVRMEPVSDEGPDEDRTEPAPGPPLDSTMVVAPPAMSAASEPVDEAAPADEPPPPVDEATEPEPGEPPVDSTVAIQPPTATPAAAAEPPVDSTMVVAPPTVAEAEPDDAVQSDTEPPPPTPVDATAALPIPDELRPAAPEADAPPPLPADAGAEPEAPSTADATAALPLPEELRRPPADRPEDSAAPPPPRPPVPEELEQTPVETKPEPPAPPSEPTPPDVAPPPLDQPPPVQTESRRFEPAGKADATVLAASLPSPSPPETEPDTDRTVLDQAPPPVEPPPAAEEKQSFDPNATDPALTPPPVPPTPAPPPTGEAPAPRAEAPADQARAPAGKGVPWLPIGIGVAALAVLGVIAVLVIGALVGGDDQAQLVPTPEPAAEPTAVPTPRPQPTVALPVDTVPDIHPQLEIAEALFLDGDADAAREAIGALTENEVASFSAEEQVIYDELRSALVGTSVEKSVQDLRGGLKIGSVIMIGRAVPALSDLDDAELADYPGIQQEIEHAREALRTYRLLKRAHESGDRAQVLERGATMVRLLPGNSKSREYREAAARGLEAEADTAIEARQFDRALSNLNTVRQHWPDRPGLAERIARCEQLKVAANRQQQTLDAALAKGAGGDPEAGLEMLTTAKPTGRYVQLYAQAVERLEEQLTALDANPPTVALVDASQLVFKKKQSARVYIRATDDHRVTSARAMIRNKGQTSYREHPLTRSGPNQFLLELSPEVHGNAVVEFYIQATDRSGHTAQLGSPEAPLKVEKKKWYKKN
jgi:hypothetical protein